MMLGLAGCAGFDQRKGLDPVINGAAVQSASSNKALLLDALARDAGFGPGESIDYFTVAEAGFNYVDDQCRAYFDNLFFLDRGREQIKSGLTAAGQTTAAILGVTGAAAPSLAIVAQAFGFAANATDMVTGTYLYRLPPATTQGFVEKLQLAFRDAAAANRARINTPTAAYYLIQRYLDLCLPPTIEAEITKHIGSASAISVPAGGGSLFSVESVGAPATVLRQAPRVTTTVIRNPSTPLPERRPMLPPETSDPRYTKIERGLFPHEIKQWQTALCVEPVDGNLGDRHSETRKAIRNFLVSQKARDPSDNSDASFEIGAREKVFLSRLTHSHTSCPGKP